MQSSAPPNPVQWGSAGSKKDSRMKGKGKKIQVIAYDGQGGVPVGKEIFYLCLACRSVIPSAPSEATACPCGNVWVDAESARGGANEPSQWVILQIV